eukprot:5032-Heterococcus_DN1.PRE.1
MSADAPSKRFKVAAEAELPPEALRRTDTLRVILQYVGRGDWLYAGAVSHRWCDLYRGMCVAAVHNQKRWKLRKPILSTRLPINADYFAPTASFYKAAFHSLSRLQWACNFDLKISTNTILPELAGRFADKQTLLWAQGQGLPWTAAITEGAAAEGRCSMLSWLHTEQSCPCDERAVFLAAVSRADTLVLDWLWQSEAAVERLDEALQNRLEHYGEAWHTDVAKNYASSASLLSWLKLHRQLTHLVAAVVCNDAARAGQLSSVKYLLQSYPQVTFTPALAAVRSGNVGLVKFLIDKGLALTLDTSSKPISHAVQSGSVEMLQFLQSSQLGDWSQSSLNNSLVCAGRYGNLEVVKWFRAQGAACYGQEHCRVTSTAGRCKRCSTL